MKQTTHLLVATVERADAPDAWSGTAFNMLEALRRQFDRVTVLQSTRAARPMGGLLLRLLKGPERRPLWMQGRSLRLYARRLEAEVARVRPGAVLVISSQHLVQARPLGVPTFMVSDAPWLAYREAYAAFEPMPDLGPRYGNLEAAAARRIDGVIYASPWGCAEAQRRFQLPADRVHLLPFGANRVCPWPAAQMDAAMAQKPGRPWRLLFVGRDWQRKGGDLALQTLRLLRQRGHAVQLTVAGARPEVPADLADAVQVLGFLSPAVPQHQQQLAAAYAAADLFLLPSRAECYGLVFAEAQSWGLPCVALAVQGVPGVVLHGETGRLCPPDAGADALADAVQGLLADADTYRRHAAAALQRARTVTTWPHFAQGVRELLFPPR